MNEKIKQDLTKAQQLLLKGKPKVTQEGFDIYFKDIEVQEVISLLEEVKKQLKRF